jgi:hypothetical protein
MTTGVLIFAFNNEHLDYVALAAWSAKRIHRHLGLPVTLVTNAEPVDVPNRERFDQIILADASGNSSRIFADVKEKVTWYNGNRVDAYRLSPYDQTLVLDADYVVCSDQLLTVINSNQDFLAPRWAYDVAGNSQFEDNNYFGGSKMPMSWATIMMFRRSAIAENIFNIMTMIYNNWDHYRNLYGVVRLTYRNDFALSIAMNIVDGHTLTLPTIPWTLATVKPDDKLTQLGADHFCVDFTGDNKLKYIELKQDFHAMGKKQLGDIIANNS